MIILCLIIFLFIIYLFALFPRFSQRKKCKEFTGLYYAHRGLWDMDLQIPENSIAAFQNAVDHGFAIELDVQLTKDNRAVIFHDDNLYRICGENRYIWDCTYGELQKYSLSDTPETIPLLSDVLKLVNGQTTLLIELKGHDRDTSVCSVTMDLLKGYSGSYCVESFSPFILYWFKKHHPEIIRGQLSCRFDTKLPHPRPVLLLGEHLFFNWLSRPDFIAYEYRRALRLLNLTLIKKTGTPVFAWTVRSEKNLESGRKRFDSIIFDHFIPPSTYYSLKD